MSRPFALRPFRPDDLDPLVALMRDTLGLARVTPELVARDMLLAPGFAPDHLHIAHDADRPVGYIWAPRRDSLGVAGTGWIAALGVAPDFRRRGIASALVAHALDTMRAEGVKRVDVADVPVRYLLPGIDAEAFPIAHRWFREKLGFTIRDEVASMGFDLSAEMPPFDDAQIRVCRPGEYPGLKAFLTGEFDPGWWGYFERSILARLNGDPTPSAVLCVFEDGAPIGTVHYRADRFGPLAVGARARGRGLGARLTLAALAHMKATGFRSAYFLVAAPDVQPFYARLGFTVLRRFTRLTRPL